jgi:hypothetical protein
MSNLNFASFDLPSSSVTTNSNILKSNSITFESSDISSSNEAVYSQLGSSSNFRNNPFTNPIISYDYKCGHYLGI